MHQPLCTKMNTSSEILETEVVIKAPGKIYKWLGHETSAKITKRRKSLKPKISESESGDKRKSFGKAKDKSVRKTQDPINKRQSLPTVRPTKIEKIHLL